MPDPVTLAGFTMSVAEPVVQKALDSAMSSATQTVGKITRSIFNRAAVALRLGFEDYLKSSYIKCAQFKTLLNPHEPLSVEDYYVNITLSYQNSSISDTELMAQIHERKLVIVSGLAGGGKSMLMKYITLNEFKSDNGKIPLFVELRHINQITNQNLIAFIRSHCATGANKISEDQFNIALQEGIFTLILDGFDEINHDQRDNIQSQILELHRRFPETGIIVSSRPDDRFGGWVPFYVFRVEKLSKQQCNSLIKSLEYNKDVKKRFLKEVNSRLYESHKSFLSSPLLTTIMLLTYEEFAEIPDKMHAFYSQAFDTLFQKHDAQKDQFQRKTHTGLPREEFRVCLAAFCAISYLSENFSFSEDKLQETASQAIRYAKELKVPSSDSVTAKQFISDLRESVCLLQQDGTDHTFVHRSFQEYFSALFVTKLHPTRIKKVIDQYACRLTDSAISMAFDMVPEVVEQEWVLPSMVELGKLLELHNESMHMLAPRFMKLTTALHYHRSGDLLVVHLTEVNVKTFGILSALEKLYPNLFGNPHAGIWGWINCIPIGKAKRIWTDKSLSKHPNFKSMQKIIDPASDGKRELVSFILSEQDNVWLEKLGCRDAFIVLRESIEKIVRDIEKRALRRTAILDALF